MSSGNIDLTTFRKSQERMVSKNDASWDDPYGFYRRSATRLRDYTLEEVDRIINSDDLGAKQRLSRNYFAKDGFYRRLIIYYATLLKYVGVLITNPVFGKTLSDANIVKRYNHALNYVESLNLPVVLTNCSLRALIDGCYYGFIQKLDKDEFVLLDLPTTYCATRLKDLHGNDIIEFDVRYFDTILDENIRKQVLNLYPKVVADHYNKFRNGKVVTSWAIIPAESGVCFPFFDGLPPFLNVIPSTIQYDEAVDNELERQREEINKIIVQHMPHLTDGQLVFEPEEAAEMHSGSVDMLRGNKNLSVLTTYADVDAIVSKGSTEGANGNLEKMMKNIYYEASTSAQIFSPDGNLAIETSIKNDMSMMMFMANKYSHFVSYILNTLFANGIVKFKYTILPVSYYNESSYVNDALKMAQNGYSLLIPSIAMGFSQSDLINLKELEEQVLGLHDKLRPLQNQFGSETSGNSTGEVGRPRKENDEKSIKTIQNEQSIDKTGGSK